MKSPYPRDAITGLVLAGGQARRMGGVDKGLIEVAGRPMIDHVLAVFEPQVGRVLINANRSLDRYAHYGHRVVTDTLGGFQGPLAGVLSALDAIETELLLTVPRLSVAGHRPRGARGPGRSRCSSGPGGCTTGLASSRCSCCAASSRCGPGEFPAGGGRKIDLWFARHHVAEADLSDRLSFINVNDPDERQRVEAMLLSRTARPE
jgi:molybdopterin-guanine dinucleotide biosynthesis protein A